MPNPPVEADFKVFSWNVNVSAGFEKLEGASNYMDWKMAMEAHLFNVDLWDCVETLKTDVRQNKRARGAIISGVKSHLFSSIREMTTGKDVWDRLEKLFEPKGLYREVALLEELTSIHYSDCANMEAYLDRKVTAAQKLQAINSTVQDRLLAGMILMKLPEEFNALIQSISSQDSDITTELVKERLLAESARQEAQKRESALAGHFRSGQKNSSRSGGDSKHVFRGKCRKCDKPGHKARDCSEAAQGKIAEVLEPQGRGELALKCSPGNPLEWIIDSGASTHMSGHRDLFISMSNDGLGRSVSIANSAILTCQGTGDVRIGCISNGKEYPVRLRDVLYIPGLTVNLISVKQLAGRGFSVAFPTAQRCEIRDGAGKVCASATSKANGLYILDSCSRQALVTRSQHSADYQTWHRRLGHLHEEAIRKMASGTVDGIQCRFPTEKSVCRPCAMGKQRRESFQRSKTMTKQKLELVHSDVCGPMKNPSVSGYRYFVTFIDDFTRYTVVCFLRSKSEVYEKLVQFIRLAERSTGCKLRTLRTDNGSEYINHRTSKLLRQLGIRHETSVEYCPEQNGKSEIVNRILVEKARSMLADSCLEPQYWAEALRTAAKLKNVSSTSSLEGMCPEEAWSGRKPDLQYLRIFGCLAYGHVPQQKRKKWDVKSQAYIFVGYCDESKAYRLIPLDDRTRLVKSRDVIFDESRMAVRSEDVSKSQGCDQDGNSEAGPAPDVIKRLEKGAREREDSRENNPDDSMDAFETPTGTPHTDQNAGEETIIATDDDNPENSPQQLIYDPEFDVSSAAEPPEENPEADRISNDPSAVQELDPSRRSTRERRAPERYGDFACACDGQAGESLLDIGDDLDTPSTVREALSGPHAAQWKEAMDREMKAHRDNETWKIIKKPTNEKIITSKWVFRIKRNEIGEIVLFKCRLVARGCAQVQGIDFDENFSPVVKAVTLRTLFACAARNGWSIHQLDIETAYLHGILNERVLMQAPEGYDHNGGVCLLQRPLYGLRQAGRTWFDRLRSALTSLRLTPSEADPCLFTTRRNGRILILTVYVDDLLLFSDCQELRKDVSSKLAKMFPVKDLGLAKFCLGVHITQDQSKKQVLLNQKEYISQILKRFSMSEAKTAITPMEVGLKLVKRSRPPEDQGEDGAKAEPYREAVGCLIHLSQTTRPDICHAVGTVAKFSANPAKEHWSAVKRILRYLKGSIDLQLHFDGHRRDTMTAYADADWGGCEDCRRSTTGYCVQLAGACVSWNSRKQPTVALSSSEAEYMSVGAAAQEIKWLLNLRELLPNEISRPFPLWNDNQGAIALSGNAINHKRVKHVDLRHHFIRQMVSEGDLIIRYLSTTDMIADIFTKSLCSAKFTEFRSALGLK